MGWLDAVLKPARKTKKSKPDPDDAPLVTRREKLLADGAELPMLDPGPAAYLLEIFTDLGPVHHTPMGEAPIGYEQLYAWCGVTRSTLSHWEAATLREMSFVYCMGKSEGQDPLAPAPGGYVETQEQAQERRDRVSQGLAQQLRSFRRKPDA